MNVPQNSQKTLILLLCFAGTASLGCVAGGPLTAFNTPGLDDREPDPALDRAAEGRAPVRQASFLSFDVLPHWPSGDEAAEASSSVAAPLAAGSDAVKRGVGQVQSGFIQLGRGTRRAFTTTTNYLSRPLVAVRTTPGEPSFLARMFGAAPEDTGPRTTREFFKQERLR